MGITFLFVTHDQEEALSLSDRLGVMNKGRLEQVGTPEEIYLRPSTRFVASFLGAVNWIGGVGVRPEAMRIARAAFQQRRVVRVPPPSFSPRSSATASTWKPACPMASPRWWKFRAWVKPSAPGERVHLWWEPADELRFAETPQE